MQIKIGSTYQLEITGLSHEGAGVGRLQGLAVFVPGALPGEQVEVKLTVLKSKFAKAKLSKVLTPAAARLEPVCSHYENCGGCQLQHLDYQEQLQQKTLRVKDSLTRIGKLEGFKLHRALGMLEPWYYRNKAQFHAGLVNGRLRLGYYSPGTHQLVPIEDCRLLPKEFTDIITGLEEIFSRRGLMPYDRKISQGLLKHVILKRSWLNLEIMIVIVLAALLEDGKDLGKEIIKAFPRVVSVVQSINPQDKHILGTEFNLLAGEEQIKERLGDLEYLISAAAFFQVNPEQTEVLYNKALEYAGLSGKETVLDLYCGTGTISLLLARHADKVYGIEEVEMATEDAKQNAILNGITNVEFHAGRVEELLPRLAAQEIHPEVIVLDPPRQGCDQLVLEAAATLHPQRLVYISCDPGTLARDLRLLQELGYKTIEVQPVDMFPQTAHVESIVLMTNSGLKGK